MIVGHSRLKNEAVATSILLTDAIGYGLSLKTQSSPSLVLNRSTGRVVLASD